MKIRNSETIIIIMSCNAVHSVQSRHQLCIRPAGSGTAKLSWKERLLALHFHERGLYHPLFPN